MADETDKAVNRDAWRAILAQGGDEPSALTDARIRAAARRAVPPRAAGWWLPASLAASMLLAVLVVQWQYESRGPAAVMTESDVAVPAAAPASERMDEGAAALADRENEKKRESELFYLDMEPRSPPPEAIVPPPVVPPPMIDLPAANESRAVSPVPAPAPPPVVAPEPAPAAERGAAAAKSAADKDLGEMVVTGNRRREENLESTTPVTQVTSADAVGAVGNLQKSRAAKRPPEEWYAEIEKLRAAGKKKEAESELEKLEAAHPGWVEEYLKQVQKKE